MRSVIYLALTKMVKPNPNAIAAAVANDTELTCPMNVQIAANGTTTIEMELDHEQRYDWSEELQGYILSSYYIGIYLYTSVVYMSQV